MRKQFFIVFLSLANLSSTVEDKYLKFKLVNKANGLFNSFLEFEKEKDEVDVAQSGKDFKKLISHSDELVEFVEILEHLRAVGLSPALLAKKNLLFLKDKILDFRLKQDIDCFEKHQESDAKQSVVLKPLTKIKKEKKRPQEKILEFVRNSGEVSAKDVILAFAGAFSKRTVQRYLTRLAKNNSLKKEDNGKVVKYYAV